MWAYPSVDPAFRELLMRKCALTGDSEEEEEKASSTLEYSYGHFAEVWYYLLNVSAGNVSQLDKVCDLEDL